MRASSSLLTIARGGGVDGFSFPGPRALKHIAKLPLLQREPAEEVRRIWLDHHRTHKTAVADVISAEQYSLLMGRAARCPMFILPVKQPSKGHYMMFTQWQRPHCLLTYLDDYKRFASAASPYMIITVFDELLREKKLALVRGEVFTDKLSKNEAERLLRLIKLYYLGADSCYEELIKFNERPAEFDVEKLLRAAE